MHATHTTTVISPGYNELQQISYSVALRDFTHLRENEMLSKGKSASSTHFSFRMVLRNCHVKYHFSSRQYFPDEETLLPQFHLFINPHNLKA